MSVERSDEIGELIAALIAASAEVALVEKDQRNDFQKYDYAGLPSVIKIIKPVLANHGLAALQFASTSDDIVVTTMLVHASGQWMRTQISHTPDRQKGRSDIQAVGSTITYLRRYALMGLLGLAATTDDDDGRAAPPRQEPKPKPEPIRTTHHESWDDDSTGERRKFFAILTSEYGKSVTYGDVAGLCAELGRPRPSCMEPEKRAALLSWLRTDRGRDRLHEHIERQAIAGDGGEE